MSLLSAGDWEGGGEEEVGEGILGSFLSLSSVERRLAADTEDLVSTTDFLRLITQSMQVQGSEERCEGEVWRKASSCRGSFKGNPVHACLRGEQQESSCPQGTKRWLWILKAWEEKNCKKACESPRFLKVYLGASFRQGIDLDLVVVQGGSGDLVKGDRQWYYGP